MTAGAIALAVIAPAAAESAEHAADAAAPAPPSAVAAAPGVDLNEAFAQRPGAEVRSSRSALRRVTVVRPAVVRAVRAEHIAVRRAPRVRPVQRRRPVQPVRHVRYARPTAVARIARLTPVRGAMGAVLAFARAHVGSRYVTGGESPNGYDCSGFTKQAYARAGLALPHSADAQAARAHSVSRSQARPGDLVVGAGHVGIYMGGGMMIDAGNHRVGVVYRKLYGGLHIERF